jgi:glucosamine--fructose-6-phosphate aminotransferase (isomerizing)
VCGIIGYIGRGNSLNIIVDGLKRLEYRGYDSAGVAYLNGKGLDLVKAKGKLQDLFRLLPQPLPVIRMALGHTRWATHGVPSAENAHPHAADDIVVVHNGIIENHHELKKELESEGHIFRSQTDTEVVPHLIARSIKNGGTFRHALEETVRELSGSFALGVFCSSCPDVLFAVRQGSPLVLGIGDGEFFFASDIPALLPYTRKVAFLADGEICALTREGIEITHLASNRTIPAKEKMITIEWTASMAEKDGHDHFMHKEIYEQPRAVMETIADWTQDPVKNLIRLGIYAPGITDLRRFHIAACGTSYHAGLVGKYLIERLARIPVDVEIASEYRYRRPVLEPGTVFISITQSGETADTLGAQREARASGVHCLTICNVMGSTASREADAVLQTRSGPEIGVASTKAFTAQLAALSVLAAGLGAARGASAEARAGELLSSLQGIPRLMEKVLPMDGKIRELARSVMDAKGFLFLGRGVNYPVALEGALKLKEISYLHAEGYAAGEMKHGPIALIEENLPVIVLAPRNSLFEKTLSNIEEVKARGGRVIAVTDDPGALRNKADDVLEVPPADPLLAPLLTVIPLQLLAYHAGVLRGSDVDQPRNLAKSVTVE